MHLIGFQIFEKEIWGFGKIPIPHRTCRKVVDFGARRVDFGAGGLRRRIGTFYLLAQKLVFHNSGLDKSTTHEDTYDLFVPHGRASHERASDGWAFHGRVSHGRVSDGRVSLRRVPHGQFGEIRV